MKIYLASPFFNEIERNNVCIATKILRDKNLDVFVPMEHKVKNEWDLSNADWGKAVFEMDKDALDECDVMVILYYGLYSDSGTAFEVGYFYANKKPIICVVLDKQITSLMIINSATIILEDFQKLKDFDFKNIKKSKNNSKFEQK